MNKMSMNRHQVVFWIALALLFILRLPFSWLGNAIPSTMVWTDTAFDIGTYVLIVFLIWWERETLEIHHMDAFAIFIIIMFKPISSIILRVWRPDSSVAFPHPLSFIYLLAAIILLVLILRKKIKIKFEVGKSILWMIAGAFIGIVLTVSAGIIFIKFFGFPIPGETDPSMWLSPVYQIGQAAVVEEPFFRGFLWGGLKKVGMKDIYILFIQAVLFTSGHLHLLNTTNPVLNLSYIFIAAMVMGILVWRSRKLSASMMVHGMSNGSAIFQFWIYSLIFK